MAEVARQRAFEAAQAAFGAIEPTDARTLRARVDGRDVLVCFDDTVFGSSRGQRRVPFGLTTLRVPLPRQLPIVIGAEVRQSYVHLGSIPETRTGDPAFDARIFVFGSPAEVVAAALEPATRAWIVSMGENPTVRLEDACVTSHWSTPGVSGRTTSADLLQAARAQIRLADACVAAYDARHHAIRQERGDAAADAWHAAAVAAVTRRAEDAQRRRRILIAGCVAAIVGLLLLGLLAIVGVLSLLW
jgi:hypothetical protein